MLIAVDTETTGLSLRHGCDPFTVSTCTEAGKVRLWQWPVDPITRKVDVNGIDRQEIIDYLDGHELIFHSATFDLRALANIGILFSSREFQWEVPEVTGVWSYGVEVSRIHDTLFMSHLTDSRGVYTADGRTVHGLKELALCRLGISDGDEEALRKAVVKARLEGKKLGWSLGMDRQGDSQVSWDYWMPKALYDHDPKSWKPFKTVCREYAANDAIRTMQLYLACQEIIKEDGRWQMYLDELQFIPILYMIEEIGMHIHEKSLRKELQGHHKAISRLTDELYRLAGPASGITNINSHPQLRRLLFEVWNLGATTLTKTGQASTAVEVLTNLRDYLTAKEEASGKGSASTPLKFLRALVGYRDGSRPVPGLRTHEKAAQYLTFYSNELTADSRFAPSINPVGTKTTRWSTKGSQNIGAKQLVDDETGEQIVLPLRGVFGPDKDHLWVSIDYEQLELHIFAALSGEQSLINSFEEGHDFHGYVAERIFKKPPDKITKEERTIAKNTNFAMIYGGSPAKVDATAGMKGAYDSFIHQFPNAKQFMEETISFARKNGHVLTADGYPLWVPPREPYKGTDYRIQGTAGRIIKLAMRWLVYGRQEWKQVDGEKQYTFRSDSTPPVVDWHNVKMICQIHDELLFEISKRLTTAKIVAIVRRCCTVMEQAGQSMGIETPTGAKIFLDNWSKGISIREYIGTKERRHALTH